MKHMITRDGFVITGPATVHVWRKENGDADPYLEKIDIDLPMIFPYLRGPEWCICRPGHWATLLDTTFSSELVAYQVMKAECEQMNTGSPGFRSLVDKRIAELSQTAGEAARSIARVNRPARA
jgi:hypothetical protein